MIMKEFCPNKASKEFKELASIFGEDKAYFLWMRNKGNELDKAPNGAESKLFQTLLNEFNGDRTEALKAKAKVYSNDFLNWFGNWIDVDLINRTISEQNELFDDSYNSLDVSTFLEKSINYYQKLLQGKENSATKMNKQALNCLLLMKEMLSNIDVSDIKIQKQDFLKYYKKYDVHANEFDVKGLYYEVNDRIYFNRFGPDVIRTITVLHEIIHAVTYKKYKQDFDFRQRVDDLYNYVKNYFPNNELYVFSDPTEMLAEIVNPDVQYFYLKIPSKTNNKSLLYNIIDIIKNAFGFGNNRTVFDDFVDLIKEYGEVVKLNTNNVSKVVDENGEPLVVYHGTNSELSVDKKGPAIYATNNPSMADSYYYSDSNVADDMESYYDNKEESYALEREGAYERALDILENGEFTYSDTLIDDWYNFIKESHPEYGGFEQINGKQEIIAVLYNKVPRKDYEKIADEYAEYHRPSDPVKYYENKITGSIYPLFMNIKNPLIVDADGKYWDEIPFNGELLQSTRDIEQFSAENGYDGFVVKSVIDYGGYVNSINFDGAQNIYVVFTMNNAKSATSNKQDIITEEPGFSTEDDNIYHNLTLRNVFDNLKDLAEREVIELGKMSLAEFNSKYGTNLRYANKFKTRLRVTDDDSIWGIKVSTKNDTKINPKININTVQLRTYLVDKFGLKIDVISDDEYDKKITPNKSSSCCVKGDTVYIRQSRNNNLTNEQYIEEFLHPAIHQLYKNNKDLSKKLVEQAKTLFPDLCKQIEYIYKLQGDDVVEEEIITQVLSKYLNKEISDNGENSRDIINYISQFFEYVFQIFKDLFGNLDIKYLQDQNKITVSGRDIRDVLNYEHLAHIINSKQIIFRDILNREEIRHNLQDNQNLQQSVFDIYSRTESERTAYLKQIEDNYKASNPNATSEDIARVVQTSRIQYNKERINAVLSDHQRIVAQSFGMTMQNGYYIAPDNLTSKQKQVYEWVINSLNPNTFEAYKQDRNDVYNVMSPDQQASINVIYQAITNGNLQTLDKELARNYIRIFWNSDLIQAGLKLFDNGHTTIQQQEQKLIEAITQTDPEQRIQNKSLLDYIKTFWNDLLNIAKKIFNNENISDNDKQSLLNGITSATVNIQDLDLSEGVQPIYDRIDGNYDSSKLLSPNDKAIFSQIKSGTHVRLKSQLSRNVKNTKFINDLKLRLEILDNVNDDNIDQVFDSIQDFLENADIELQKTLKFINDLKQKDPSTWDAQQINYIKQDLIGFYEGLLSNINGMFNDPTSSIAKLNKLRIQEGKLDLESTSKQLVNDIRNLNDVYTRDIVLPYAEKILVDFVNESDAVKDKPTFIKNMKHWLYQDSLYGDLQAGELIFGMASRSRSPIVRIIEKMISDTEFEKNREVLRKGRQLMSLYNKIRPTGSQISFNNFQKMFIELDGEDGTTGLPTGYFIRDINYGRFYAEKDKFEENLRKEFVAKGLTWKENPYTGQIQLIFPDEDYTKENSVYNQYYDALDEWLDEHCERRYTLEYYKAKRRHLSPAALQAQSFIQRQIDLLIQQAITERGNIDTNKLNPDQKKKLSSLRKQKRELASPYLFTTDSNGVVLVQEKQGEDLEIARQISKWNKFISDKVKYKENTAAFEADLNELKAKYGENSPEVRRFIYDNKQQKINPVFWDYINSKIDKAQQTAEYEELRARYRDIINHVKDYNGYVVPDLAKFGIGLNQNSSVWAELKRLEQRMAEIRRQGKRLSGEEFNYLSSEMVPLLGSEDKTFYQYLYDKWAPQFNEHPELRQTFNDLFTYVDKKGRRKVLEVFKYIKPSTATIDPGIPTIITTLSSQYSEIDESSEYVNKRFNKILGEYLQPKTRKPGTKRIKGKIDYTNDNYQKIADNPKYKQFYYLLISTMNEANAEIPTRATERSYLMPQITGRGMSILGRSLIGHELFSSIGYGIQDFVGYKFAEQDKDVSTNWDLPRRPDGTVVNNIPIRFVKRLEKPYLISTDVIGSVMMYYDMAMNYSLKAKNLPSLELLENAVNPINAKPFMTQSGTKLEPLTKQYDKIKNMLDFRYYGKEDRNIADQSHPENKLMQSTTTVGKRFRSFASLSMLALNFTTIEVGYIDAFLSAIADSVGGKYFGKEDLAVGYKETLLNLPQMLCNLGNPDTNNWMVCAMQYNQLSRSNSEIFDRTDQTRASKLLHMTLMGGYTVGDYLINTMILGATYNHYKLVDTPDGSSKAFMSKSDAIDLYTKYGYTEKEAIDKYSSAKITLRQAYIVEDGVLTPKKEYNKYITKKLENQIAGRLRDRTHLYNGVIPTVEKAKIQQNVWGSYVTLMRNFYVNTYWERAAVGFDYAEQESLPSGSFGRYASEQAGMVNFETGETGNALGMSFLHGLKNYIINIYRLFKHKDLKNLSRDQKYALKRISTEIAIIGMSIFMALWSLAFARRNDLDDKTSSWVIDLISPEQQQQDYDIDLGVIKVNSTGAADNMLNWVRWKLALLSTRTMTERSTFYWPGTGLELVQSVSTAQSYTKDLGYMIDLFMDLLSINGHDSSTPVKTGGYSGMSRGTRDLIKIAGPLGIDNLVRNWHTSGLKSTLNWYSGITPNNFILPNKSTWEEQEGISKTSDSKGKSKSRKKSHR